MTPRCNFNCSTAFLLSFKWWSINCKVLSGPWVVPRCCMVLQASPDSRILMHLHRWLCSTEQKKQVGGGEMGKLRTDSNTWLVIYFGLMGIFFYNKKRLSSYQPKKKFTLDTLSISPHISLWENTSWFLILACWSRASVVCGRMERGGENQLTWRRCEKLSQSGNRLCEIARRNRDREWLRGKTCQRPHAPGLGPHISCWDWTCIQRPKPGRRGILKRGKKITNIWMFLHVFKYWGMFGNRKHTSGLAGTD